MMGRLGWLMVLWLVAVGVKAAEPAPPAPLVHGELVVQGVRALPDFAAVQSLLRGLPSVKQLRLVSLDANTASFVLTTSALGELKAALAAEPRLPLLKEAAQSEVALPDSYLGRREWQPNNSSPLGMRLP